MKNRPQNIILSFKDMFDGVHRSAAKCIRDDVIIHWCLTFARFSATPRCISCIQQAQCLLLFKQTVDGLYLPVFQYTAAVHQQSIQTGSAQRLRLKFP